MESKINFQYFNVHVLLLVSMHAAVTFSLVSFYHTDLFAPSFTEDLRSDGNAGDERIAKLHCLAIRNQKDILERHILAIIRNQTRHGERVAFLDFFLKPSDVDDGKHRAARA